MPGIRITQPDEFVQPGGDINAQASPVDFGAGIAQGIGALGADVGHAAQQVANVEEDQGRIWAATAVSQKELQLRQNLQTQVNSLDPNDPDYASKIAGITSSTQSAVSDAQNDLMQQAPGKYARKFVSWHMASAGLRLTDAAMQTQSQLNASYTTGLVQNGIKADSDLLAASPDNDTYQRLLSKQQQAIGGLSTISPILKQRLIEDTAHTYAQVQVQSQLSRDPFGFLQSIGAQGGTTTSRGAVKGQVPTGVPNFGADTVAPYSAQHIQDIAAKAKAPSPYDPLFQEAGAKYNVSPLELKMRAAAESGLQPNASSGQANGIMQLAPATAKQLGVDANDPAQAIDGAARLLSQYGRLSAGDTSKVDEMYYGGAAGTAWGPNTKQYAANLGAVRAILGTQPDSADPQVQPLDEQAIAQANPQIAGWGKLTWQEKVTAVRQAESLQGKGLAEDRGALTRELKDANATVLSGQTYPGLDSPRYSAPNLQRVFGPDQGQRLADELQYNQQVGHYMASLGTMPAAQRDATLQQLAPASGMDFAQREPVYKMAEEAAQRVQLQQMKDPIGTAIQNGIGGAQPLDFSKQDTLASQLMNRAKVATTMQRDYGAPSRIFTDQETNALDSQLAGMSGKDRIGLLGTIRVGLNDPQQFATAMDQVAPKRPVLAYAANLAAKDGTAYVDGSPQSPADIAATIADGDIILHGRDIGKPPAPGEDPAMPGGSHAVKLDDKTFQTLVDQSLGNAFQSPDPQRSAASEQEAYNAIKAYYVADSYKQGKALNVIDPDGVSRAIQAVVGTPWQKNGGVLLAPYGMPVEKFQQQWPQRAQAAITSAGYDATDAENLMSKAIPVNLADGRYGFQVGTRLLSDPRTGRKVIVDYGQPVPDVAQIPGEMPNTAQPVGASMMRRN